VADTSRPAITPGMRRGVEQDTITLFGHHLKARFSPRIAVSHPVTDRTKLFYNYGRFSQWPTYFYVYSKIGSVSSEDFPLVGNVNLDPEVSSQFEFGAAHEFSDRLSANLTFFFKDQYDYPTPFRRLGQADFFILNPTTHAPAGRAA
jgi:outer membrane receptor protein involved in Fe transport